MTAPQSPDTTDAALWHRNLEHAQAIVRTCLEALGESGTGDGGALTTSEREVRELRAKVDGYESAITWQTDCTSCARLLDASIGEHERAERATETERERIRQLAVSVGATWLEPCDASDEQHALHSHHRRKFADLIGEQQEDSGA